MFKLEAIRTGRSTFQTKVLLSVVPVMVALVIAIVSVMNRHFTLLVRSQAEKTLQSAHTVFKDTRDYRAKNLLLRYHGVTLEPRFKAVFQLADPKTIDVLLNDLIEQYGAEMMMFTSPQEEVIGFNSIDDDLNVGGIAASIPAAIRSMEEGEPGIKIASIEERLYELFFIPTEVGGNITGVLTIASEFGDRVAEEFKRLTGSEIIFYENGEATASSAAISQWRQSMLEAGLLKSQDTDPHPDPDHTDAELLVSEDNYFVCEQGTFETERSNSGPGYLILISCTESLLQLRTTQRMFLVFSILGISLSSLAVWLLISRIIRPLHLLRERAEAIGQGDFSGVISIQSHDELGDLAETFNQMTVRLKSSRTELEETVKTLRIRDRSLEKAQNELENRVEERTRELSLEIRERKRAERDSKRLNEQLILASRQAGMAEVATGVLHNVGNVLNSINVSYNLVRERLRKSRLKNLKKLSELLRKNEPDLARFISSDPKGRMLPGYFSDLTDHLLVELSENIEEMHLLGKNVEHVKEIVAMQQSYGKLSGVMEPLSVDELVDDVLQMNKFSLERNEIEITRRYQEVPLVVVDRHKVLQILVNLVRNAEHSLVARNQKYRELIIRIVSNEAGNVRVEVQDNGGGIEKENLARIFSHGFTTKSDGHGYGLHTGALAARDMGGALKAHSEGLGMGATFSLELPVVELELSPPSPDETREPRDRKQTQPALT